MENVFDKITDAVARGSGVTLTSSEIWLLDEMVGEQIAVAAGEFVRMQDLFEEYAREKNRETDSED